VGQNLNDKIAFILGRREYAHAVAAEYACPNNSPLTKHGTFAHSFPKFLGKIFRNFAWSVLEEEKMGGLAGAFILVYK
jgi:hypothetical protein